MQPDSSDNISAQDTPKSPSISHRLNAAAKMFTDAASAQRTPTEAQQTSAPSAPTEPVVKQPANTNNAVKTPAKKPITQRLVNTGRELTLGIKNTATCAALSFCTVLSAKAVNLSIDSLQSINFAGLHHHIMRGHTDKFLTDALPLLPVALGTMAAIYAVGAIRRFKRTPRAMTNG